MPHTSRSLEQLRQAAETLETEAAVVETAVRALSSACPRALALAYTIRGRPAQALGVIRVFGLEHDTGSVDLPGFQRLYESAASTFYDRYRVDSMQRERWMALPGDWFRGCELRRSTLRPYGAMSRVVVCLGSRPVACLGLLLKEGDVGFSAEEDARLRALTPLLCGPTRVAALVAEAGSHLDAVDHLMASRTDAAFLVSTEGRLLACSGAGQLALSERPALREEISTAARRSRGRARDVLLPGGRGQLHVSPCSPRGGSSALLAVLGERPQGRVHLTVRQAELVARLRDGLSNAAIGACMGLSPATVKTMLERLYRRAGVSGRVALLRSTGAR